MREVSRSRRIFHVQSIRIRSASEVQGRTYIPCHDMVCAGCVSRYADSPNLFAILIQGKAAAENIYPADALVFQRIILGAEGVRTTAIGPGSIDRIAVLQAIEAPAWIDFAVQHRG